MSRNTGRKVRPGTGKKWSKDCLLEPSKLAKQHVENLILLNYNKPYSKEVIEERIAFLGEYVAQGMVDEDCLWRAAITLEHLRDQL